VFALCVTGLTPFLGHYMFRVFEGDDRPFAPMLGRIERLLYRWGGARLAEQTWQEYALALLAFSAVGVLSTYALQRLQHLLPLNPAGLGPVEPTLAFNTAVSFVTNTNWQNYAGETTMSHLTQMLALGWQNFMSAAVGVAVALAFARGLTRQQGPEGPGTLGNFWQDLVRTTVYVLLPIACVVSILLVSQGVVQTLAPPLSVTTLEGAQQILALGPVASQEAIKQLGTNGGGFFNANSAHPFENPTPLTNFVQMLLIFAVPAGLTSTYGRMARDRRQGWALFAAMGVLFLAGVAALYAAESQPNAAFSSLPVAQTLGNMEGKETRFGLAASALFTTVTTDASCGAVNATLDSMTPLGGLVPLVNIQLGEVIFGGVGAGLYGLLIFVLLTVFIAGLMVGRTPEYLGKKVEAHDMKLCVLYILVFPLCVLGLTACAAVAPYGATSLLNRGPHGLAEMLYAYTSAGGNNGSALAGLNGNTPGWNLTLAFAMLAGRFMMIVPVLAIAGSMVKKRVVLPGPGTFPTHGPLFATLLVAVVVVVGALTFFPALCLGPIVEHFVASAGKAY
jgi:K+-transporting ATPase ATPase A chain